MKVTAGGSNEPDFSRDSKFARGINSAAELVGRKIPDFSHACAILDQWDFPISERSIKVAHSRKTGKKAASAAGKVLANPRSTKAEKSAAASALSQTHGKGKGASKNKR